MLSDASRKMELLQISEMISRAAANINPTFDELPHASIAAVPKEDAPSKRALGSSIRSPSRPSIAAGRESVLEAQEAQEESEPISRRWGEALGRLRAHDIMLTSLQLSYVVPGTAPLYMQRLGATAPAQDNIRAQLVAALPATRAPIKEVVLCGAGIQVADGMR
jgi:hypothetical protein